MVKQCVLYDDRVCNGCGECDRCDLDPDKVCDNCMKCMGEGEFRSVLIDGIMLENELQEGDSSPS